jgi:hypothetical protein
VTYSSGNYTVAEASCGNCNEPLGVKYVSILNNGTFKKSSLFGIQLEAADGENAYKVGTYLVEKPRLKIVSIPAPEVNRIRSNSANDATRKVRRSSFLNIFSFLRKTN